MMTNALPWLTTAANRIVVAGNGATVVLRGINRSGLEYAADLGGDFLDGAHMKVAEFEEIIDDWGAPAVPIPFSQSRVLDDATSAAYLLPSVAANDIPAHLSA